MLNSLVEEQLSRELVDPFCKAKTTRVLSRDVLTLCNYRCRRENNPSGCGKLRGWGLARGSGQGDGGRCLGTERGGMRRVIVLWERAAASTGQEKQGGSGHNF